MLAAACRLDCPSRVAWQGASCVHVSMCDTMPTLVGVCACVLPAACLLAADGGPLLPPAPHHHREPRDRHWDRSRSRGGGGSDTDRDWSEGLDDGRGGRRGAAGQQEGGPGGCEVATASVFIKVQQQGADNGSLPAGGILTYFTPSCSHSSDVRARKSFSAGVCMHVCSLCQACRLEPPTGMLVVLLLSLQGLPFDADESDIHAAFSSKLSRACVQQCCSRHAVSATGQACNCVYNPSSSIIYQKGHRQQFRQCA